MSKQALSKQQIKIIALACLGGALEFYDFIIFIFFAPLLSKIFFPEFDKVASMLATYSVFAIGYLARPLGGIFFGHLGDKLGRKNTFALTVAMMAVPTFLLGLLPSYQQIGISATILVVILRLMQGFSVGGEIPGATVFAAESVSHRHRGFACSLIFFGVNSGLLLGSFVSALIINHLNSAQQLAWGWRLAFLFGGVLGLVSYYLRKKISESPVFSQMEAKLAHEKAPIAELFRDYRTQALQGICITALGAVIISMVFLYMPNFLMQSLHYPHDTILTINTIMIAIFSLLIAGAGFLSDRTGRRKLMIVASLLLSVLAYPLYSLFTLHSLNYVIVAYSGLMLLSAVIVACYPCMLTELFPTRIRYTGYAFSYNIAFAIFGGLTPLTAEALIHYTQQPLAASLCLIISGGIALFTVLFMHEKYQLGLEKI